MTLAQADIAFANDLFNDIPALTTRRMFGGVGFYSDGTIFALLLSDGRLMLKAQTGAFADRMAGLGAERWSYTRKNGAASFMPYWTLPDDMLDDAEAACALAREALEALR